VESFLTSILYRQVLLGVRQADVLDFEVITSYSLLSPRRVQGKESVALFLDPRHPLYFNAGGRAVGVLDYEFEMERVAAPAGANACVLTPKDVVQCI
jgi:hypothetical protein